MNKRLYLGGNALALAAAAMLCLPDLGIWLRELAQRSPLYLITLAAMALAVNLVKGFRFWFILQGGGSLPVRAYVRQYCKTNFVSILIPMKMGELYRIYCFGYALGSWFRGLLFVVIDRFFDTLALVFALLSISLFTRLEQTWLIYLFCGFLFLVAFAYVALPQVCGYWKKQLLRAPATRRSIQTLSGLEVLIRMFRSAREALRGKEIILFFLSALAWLLEIGFALALEGIAGDAIQAASLGTYLSAALGLGSSETMTNFISTSIGVMLAAYLATHLIPKSRRELP